MFMFEKTAVWAKNLKCMASYQRVPLLSFRQWYYATSLVEEEDGRADERKYGSFMRHLRKHPTQIHRN